MTFDPTTPETVLAAAEARYASTTEVPPTDPPVEPPEPAPPVEPPGEPTEPATPAPDLSSENWSFDFDGEPYVVTRDMARGYAEFERRLIADEAYRARLTQALSDDFELVAKTQPTATPPPELDLEDPAVKYLYDQLTALRGELDTRAQTEQQRLAQLEAYRDNQQYATNQEMVDGVCGRFAETNGLNTEEIQEIREFAGTRVQIANDNRDPRTKVEEALDTAMWAIPKFRDRLIAAQQEQARKDATRQRKLSAVTGTSGNVPRTQGPLTATERKDAMRRAVAEAWQGNAINE